MVPVLSEPQAIEAQVTEDRALNEEIVRIAVDVLGDIQVVVRIATAKDVQAAARAALSRWPTSTSRN